jgi:hypothetical protein
MEDCAEALLTKAARKREVEYFILKMVPKKNLIKKLRVEEVDGNEDEDDFHSAG